MSITQNYQTLLEKVDKTAQKVGKSIKDISIVIAAKYATDTQFVELIDAGATHIGENRVQDLINHQKFLKNLAPRSPAEPKAKWDEVGWHFIGHLQTNKINKVLGKIDMVQSLDSIHLAEALHKKRKILRLPTLPTLLEVNIARDPAKFGIDPDHVFDFLSSLSPFSFLSIQGLMTLGKIWGNEKEARTHFAKMRELFEKLKAIKHPNLNPIHLSMGMSSDYEWAIEEGATMIRVGRILFT